MHQCSTITFPTRARRWRHQASPETSWLELTYQRRRHRSPCSGWFSTGIAAKLTSTATWCTTTKGRWLLLIHFWDDSVCANFTRNIPIYMRRVCLSVYFTVFVRIDAVEFCFVSGVHWSAHSCVRYTSALEYTHSTLCVQTWMVYLICTINNKFVSNWI